MITYINKIVATPGSGDRLVELVLTGSDDMPGCLSYLVSRDLSDADVIWVHETWDSEASQKISLEKEPVRSAIAAATPLISNFEIVATTRPTSGAYAPA